MWENYLRYYVLLTSVNGMGSEWMGWMVFPWQDLQSQFGPLIASKDLKKITWHECQVMHSQTLPSFKRGRGWWTELWLYGLQLKTGSQCLPWASCCLPLERQLSHSHGGWFCAPGKSPRNRRATASRRSTVVSNGSTTPIPRSNQPENCRVVQPVLHDRAVFHRNSWCHEYHHSHITHVGDACTHALSVWNHQI